MSKHDHRTAILDRRRSIAPALAKRLSESACSRAVSALVAARAVLNGRAIALYSPLPDELHLGKLVDWLESRGARLLYPRVVDREAKELELVEVPSALPEDKAWESGPYGIRAPHAGLPAARLEQVDLIVVPGAVFAPSGARVGMGKGYYDRLLPRLPAETLRLALAFDFQVVPELEQDPWDQPVHWIVTDTRDLRPDPQALDSRLETLSSK